MLEPCAMKDAKLGKDSFVNFVNDWMDAFMLKMRPVNMYNYPPLVVFVAVFLLGATKGGPWVRELGMNPWGAVAMMFFFQAGSILTMYLVFRNIHERAGKVVIPTLGFFVLTESIAIPAILFAGMGFLEFLGMFMTVWSVYVQASSLWKNLDGNFWRVMWGYLVYAVLFACFTMAVVYVFMSVGVIDEEMIRKAEDLLLRPQNPM